jgi:hypothetical protein
LSREDRIRWHYKPWFSAGQSEKDFFGRRKKQRFHSRQILRQICLREKILYFSEFQELRKKDSMIPAWPQCFKWFVGWDDLFPFRENQEIERCGKYFHHIPSVMKRELRMNLIFCKKDYPLWLDSLAPIDARLFPRDLYSYRRGWSWHDPELREFQSAAEVSRAAKKLGLRNKQEYSEARKKYPILPEHPEKFFDWPGQVEGFSNKESWDIILGVFDEGRINYGVEKPFFNLLQARRDIRAAENEVDTISDDPLEEEISSEAAMDALLATAP